MVLKEGKKGGHNEQGFKPGKEIKFHCSRKTRPLPPTPSNQPSHHMTYSTIRTCLSAVPPPQSTTAEHICLISTTSASNFYYQHTTRHSLPLDITMLGISGLLKYVWRLNGCLFFRSPLLSGFVVNILSGFPFILLQIVSDRS